MAAGFTVAADRLGALRDFLVARAAQDIADGDLVPELAVDGMLAPGAATPDLVALLERLAPFGTGNPEPRFALGNLRVLRAEVVGGAHLRCVLGDGGGNTRLKAMAFRALDSDLGAALLQGQGQGFHVAGHLRADRWQGRDEVQLLIDDAAPATG
jgi:single-stranded-DNA-specific exonuclease